MSIEFLEISSSYRNRTQWPSSGEFDVIISQSGSKNNVGALDPFCESAPIITWTPFSTISGNLATYTVNTIGSSTDTYILYVYTAKGVASKVRDYYAGIDIMFTFGIYTILNKIIQWRYISTDDALNRDYFQIDLSDALPYIISPGSSFVMNDPTDFSDVNRPILFIPTSVSSTNFYIKYIIYNQTRNEWLPIIYFNGRTHLAQTDSTNSQSYTAGTWTTTDVYNIRVAPPNPINTIVSVVSSTIYEIANTSSFEPNFYIGSFIRIRNLNESRRITKYDSVNKLITIQTPFTGTVSVGDTYEILPFTSDNFNPYQYNGSLTSLREAVCYDVELMNLVLPNTFLTTANGSRAVYYPYVYVELTPINNSERAANNSISSNNPNARKMLFRALVFDTTNDTTSPFVRIDGGGMIQRIKLMPADDFHFSVRLPDGSVFITEQTEYHSPAGPNPLAQISALFSFKRVSVG